MHTYCIQRPGFMYVHRNVWPTQQRNRSRKQKSYAVDESCGSLCLHKPAEWFDETRRQVTPGYAPRLASPTHAPHAHELRTLAHGPASLSTHFQHAIIVS